MTEPMDPHAALEREMAQVAAFVEDGLQVARRVAREAGITSDPELNRFERGFMAWETNSAALHAEILCTTCSCSSKMRCSLIPQYPTVPIQPSLEHQYVYNILKFFQ